MSSGFDVVVVGAGNAALCAAIEAREAGARVLVLERAPREERGGNSAFTAGAMRVAYTGVDDILELVPDLTDEQLADTDFGTYSEQQFFADIARMSEHHADPDLADLLVGKSRETLIWMRRHGVRFLPIYGRQAFKVDGRFTFWGGLTLEVSGGGPGLVDTLMEAAETVGVEVRYSSRATGLVRDRAGITGVRVTRNGVEEVVECAAVVLASGGFEANLQWRTKYLGPGWDMAKVRGSKYNTGDGIKIALEVGAAAWGQWSGAHAVGWDYNAPTYGDLRVGDGFQKHSYPFGILLNLDGKRFLDEGADFRNYTYARTGRSILAQPNHVAWQVFDSKVDYLLRDEYRIREVTKVTSDTLEGLAKQMDGMDVERFCSTVAEFNEHVTSHVPFNPNIKDTRRTNGLKVDKSNWANTIDEPPYQAYAVTCGITFTFGGLRINTDAQVIDEEELVIPGLFACGEIVGGIFYFNYPGGSGLTNGAVYGRIAGAGAALHAGTETPSRAREG
jgi:tricarballylate dehydrogenase